MHNWTTLWHHSNNFSRCPFEWTPELERSFQSSKEYIIAEIRHGFDIFDQTKRTYIRPDWSCQGIGYFLSQKHCSCDSCLPDCCTDGWRVTLAGSRFLTSAELRYAPIEGKALAVAWGLEPSKYFTQGCNGPRLQYITLAGPFAMLFPSSADASSTTTHRSVPRGASHCPKRRTLC